MNKIKNKLKFLYTNYVLPYPMIRTFILRLYKYKKFKNNVAKKIKGNGNTFEMTNPIMLNTKFEVIGNNNKIIIADGSILINVKFFIRGDNHIVRIGENCRFFRGSSIWMKDNNGYLEIGDNALIEDVHFAITEPNSKIIIGKNCMFAYEIDIRTGDSHSIIDNTSKKRINYAKDVSIGNHVWVGAYSKILKGVTIPDNCIIGTSAVVTKSMNQGNTVIAGNPAKIVKYDIDWKVERTYE